MRKSHSRKIKFEGGEFTRAELKEKPKQILMNLLIQEKNAAAELQDEVGIGKEVNRVAQKEAREAEEARDELQTILGKLETVIQFRLDTVYDEKPSQEYDMHGNPRPMVDRETPEEQKVLYKLLYMVTARTRATDRNLHSTFERGY